MTTDIFIVTYRNDYGWLKQSLAVLRKNLTGYRNIHVVLQGVLEPTDGSMVLPDVDDPTGIIWHFAPGWEGQGYYAQQYIKMCADQYSDADLILITDSDAFFTKPVHIDDFLVDGKPCWMWTRYEELGDTVPWKAITEKATGLPCELEFMRGMPFVLNRADFEFIREKIERVHAESLEVVIKQAAENGGFSEFNAMGRILWEWRHDSYHWFDPAVEAKPLGLAVTEQFWSHRPVADHMTAIRNMLDGTSVPGLRTTRMGHWIIDGDTHISKWVEETGRLGHDQDLLPRILKLIRPGDVVVDVGAFIGDHTFDYGVATRGVDSGRVLAFEPNPLAYEALRRNMEGHGHVQCINNGLGNFAGEIQFANEVNAGASHIDTYGKADTPTIGVELLDAYNLDRCDLIKIDAEGWELAVLMGAAKTIERCHPIIVLEVNRGALERNGVKKEDIYAWLKNRGYNITGDEDSEQFDVFATHDAHYSLGGTTAPIRTVDAMPLVVPVLGVSHVDLDLALQWLTWASFLAEKNEVGQHLVVTMTKRAAAHHSKLKAAVLGTRLKVNWHALPDEIERGYPISANHLFLRSIEFCEAQYSGCAILWLESDAIPVQPNWAWLISKEYATCGKPFMGHLEDKHYSPHMAGVAVYPHNWRELSPKLAGCLEAPDWPTFGRGKGTPFDTYAGLEILPQAAQSVTIQQVWKAKPFGAQSVAELPATTALFHQSKDGRLIKFLARAKYPAFNEPPWK